MDQVVVMAIAALISAASALGIIMNWRNSKLSRLNGFEKGKIDLYLSLRHEFQAIRKEISDECFYSPLVEITTDQKTHIMRYWLNAFDEWFVTNKLNKGAYRALWEEYFGPAIQSTLRSQTMVKVLVEMLEGPISFGPGKKEEFREALQALNQGLDINDRAEASLNIKANT